MDVFDLYASLSLDKSQYDKGLGEAEKSGSSIGSRIGAGFAKVGKAVTVGIGAASTAVGALASMSVKGYSDYEQLAGGVETLFKKSSQSVINNASKAYKTAGMSANEYMETVTGFSASLIQSTSRVVDQSVNTKLKQANAELARLEKTSGKGVAQQKKQLKQEIKELESNLYKTVKTQESVARAADLADQAVIDMSDNANKMGSDITSIQNAYQGFAKQNYTINLMSAA